MREADRSGVVGGVELVDGARFGLDAQKRYVVKNVSQSLVGTPRTGQDLVSAGLDVTLAKHGAAVLVVEQAP